MPSTVQLLQELVIPSFVLDRDRKVAVWNRAAEDLTGVLAAEVLGTSNHWQAFYDHERPCLADLLFQKTSDTSKLYAVSGDAGDGRRAMKVENWCTMPRRGKRAYLVIDASAIYDAEGRLQAVIETLRDTTSEQEAKAALQAQQEMQVSAIETQLAQACETLGQALTALAGGDLTCLIRQPLPGPIDALRGNFNAAVERLADVLRRTTSVAQTISEGSAEIAAASDQLSARTEQQAANLEETSAALQQIMVTVKSTAAGAAHAHTTVAATAADAAGSRGVVESAMATMSRVETSSGKIRQIIGVIDEIAFQTNLLALNAGVEAARAGDFGRGFAVVAAEVRALAQRSAEAAREIKQLIATATEEVDCGVELVWQAGEALQSIVGQVGEIDAVVKDFAATSEEQAVGLGEISAAIAQMDRTTQSNANMVVQTNEITRTLLDRTADLDELLSQFRLAGPAPSTAGRPAVHDLQRAAAGFRRA